MSWAKLARSEPLVAADALMAEVEVPMASVLAVEAVLAVALVSEGEPDGGGPGGGPGGTLPDPLIPELFWALPPLDPDAFSCAMTAAIIAPICAEPVERSSVWLAVVEDELVLPEDPAVPEKSSALAAWLCISCKR